MSLNVMITTWFKDNPYVHELHTYFDEMMANVFYFQPQKAEAFHELLNAITNQTINGENVHEQTRIKYHYTLGELEELSYLTAQVDQFKHQVIEVLSGIQTQCINFVQQCDKDNVASKLNAFFVSEVMIPFENMFKSFRQQLEERKKEHMEKQIAVSISLMTKEEAYEQRQLEIIQQAFLVGKTAQLQTTIKDLLDHWQNVHGTSFTSLLHALRINLYEEVTKQM